MVIITYTDVCNSFLKMGYFGFVVRAVLPDLVIYIYIYKADYFIRSNSDFFFLNVYFQKTLPKLFCPF